MCVFKLAWVSFLINKRLSHPKFFLAFVKFVTPAVWQVKSQWDTTSYQLKILCTCKNHTPRVPQAGRRRRRARRVRLVGLAGDVRRPRLIGLRR